MAVTTHDPSLITLESLRGSRGRARKEASIRGLFFGAASLSILISVLIVFSLAREAWNFISQDEVASLWTSGWFPRRGLYDVLTLFVGSLLVTGIAICVAGPVGMGAAVYLSEYARPKSRRVLKPMLEILAGIPSVVLGFFALTVISPEIIQRINPDAELFNLAAAGIGVGILTIPLVASIAEDAMSSVPNALREASYGMGARKVTTSVRVVIPARISSMGFSTRRDFGRAYSER